MEPFGAFLKETREQKKVTLQEISKATNISRKYLEALENEEFSIFPGEAYLKGFLRSYCIYLQLDPEKIIKQYENLMISESPTPIAQLIPKPKAKLRPILTISFLVLFSLGILGTGGYFIYYKITENKPIVIKNDDAKKTTGIPYNIEEIEKEYSFKITENDTINFVFESTDYSIMMKEPPDSSAPSISINPGNKEFYLIKTYPSEIDINEDGKYDLLVRPSNWDLTNKTIDLVINLYRQDVDTKIVLDFEDEEPEILITKDEIENIELEIDIEPLTLIKYQYDNISEIEQFYKAKSKKTINFKKRLLLSLSNAGSVDILFNNYEKKYSPGKNGEVVVKYIEWEKNEEGKYDLKISSIK